MDQRYQRVYGEIDKAARITIGKTTVREGNPFRVSALVRQLRKEKRILKKQIRSETDAVNKKAMIHKYKEYEVQVRSEIQREKNEQARKRLEKIIKDPTKNTFWKEKKRASRDTTADSMVLKDSTGTRQFDPEAIKECTAFYYETLYKRKPIKAHTYHDQLTENIQKYMSNREYEELRINQTPSIHEVTQIIMNKKNGKSMTDIKNEMLKRPGETMIKLLHPLITTIWEEETIPDVWNTGHITSLWKGKGDREDLKNYRGITTSSAIGTIMDTLLDHRIQSVVPFTQAQGGGKKAASTCDHLFIMKAIIDISIKEKRETYVTFYDVTKAYDNADNDDMLAVLWEKGFKGKAWRVLKKMTDGLKAIAKTNFGPTRTIEMEIGGRQGSSLTGRLFAKLMDMIAEELNEAEEGFTLSHEFQVPALLWVDDVITIAEGEGNQELMLQKIDDFATRHKLKWGQAKCNVMRVGSHSTNEREWKLGDLSIQESNSYKYLGDILTNDGKNSKNLESRKNKLLASSAQINSIASSDVLRLMETTVLMELHEKVNIPGLLTNSESWNLLKGEAQELERMEIQILKHLFDLPIHTPTPAIIFTLGTLYTNLRVHQKQLIYLHKILKKFDGHWTKRTLEILEKKNIGWSKKIKETLEEYGLPTDFSVIKTIPRRTWIRNVTVKIERHNAQRLLNDCHKNENGVSTPKTKTATIIEHINDPNYERGIDKIMSQLSRQECKTLVIARFKMLECGRNLKGSMREECMSCGTIEDENHILNHCIKYNSVREPRDNVVFNDVYSHQIEKVRPIINAIEKIWNTSNAHGSIRNDF